MRMLLRVVTSISIIATVVVGVITLFSSDGEPAGTAVSLAALSASLTALLVVVERRKRQSNSS